MGILKDKREEQFNSFPLIRINNWTGAKNLSPGMASACA